MTIYCTRLDKFWVCCPYLTVLISNEILFSGTVCKVRSGLSVRIDTSSRAVDQPCESCHEIWVVCYDYRVVVASNFQGVKREVYYSVCSRLNRISSFSLDLDIEVVLFMQSSICRLDYLVTVRGVFET